MSLLVCLTTRSPSLVIVASLQYCLITEFCAPTLVVGVFPDVRQWKAALHESQFLCAASHDVLLLRFVLSGDTAAFLAAGSRTVSMRSPTNLQSEQSSLEHFEGCLDVTHFVQFCFTAGVGYL